MHTNTHTHIHTHTHTHTITHTHTTRAHTREGGETGRGSRRTAAGGSQRRVAAYPLAWLRRPWAGGWGVTGGGRGWAGVGGPGSGRRSDLLAAFSQLGGEEPTGVPGGGAAGRYVLYATAAAAFALAAARGWRSGVAGLARRVAECSHGPQVGGLLCRVGI